MNRKGRPFGAAPLLSCRTALIGSQVPATIAGIGMIEGSHTQKPPWACYPSTVFKRCVLRRGTCVERCSNAARTRTYLTQATFNEAVGCVLPVSGQRSPILVRCDWRRCSSASTAVPFDENGKRATSRAAPLVTQTALIGSQDVAA